MILKFFIKSRNVGQEHCIEEESMGGQLSLFFDWLPRATYEGKKTYHEQQYDLWGYTVSENSPLVKFDVSLPPPPSPPSLLLSIVG